MNDPYMKSMDIIRNFYTNMFKKLLDFYFDEENKIPFNMIEKSL